MSFWYDNVKISWRRRLNVKPQQYNNDVVFTATTSSPENEGGEERRWRYGREGAWEALQVLDLGYVFRDSPIILHLFPGKLQPILPSGGFHPSHKPSPPYRLSLSYSLTFIHSLFTISSFAYSSLFVFGCLVAEGYWLKQSSMSPYAGLWLSSTYGIWILLRSWKLKVPTCFFWVGSMYHGSPLLLSILGPLTSQR